jgi:hypothetical protein
LSSVRYSQSKISDEKVSTSTVRQTSYPQGNHRAHRYVRVELLPPIEFRLLEWKVETVKGPNKRGDSFSEPSRDDSFNQPFYTGRKFCDFDSKPQQICNSKKGSGKNQESRKLRGGRFLSGDKIRIKRRAEEIIPT